jgi:hypothetical protein
MATVPAISIKKFIAHLRIFGISFIWISPVLIAFTVSSSSHLKSPKIHQSAAHRAWVDRKIHTIVKNIFLMYVFIIIYLLNHSLRYLVYLRDYPSLGYSSLLETLQAHLSLIY